MLMFINSRPHGDTYLRSVDVKSIRRLNDMQTLPTITATVHPLEIYSDGRAFLVFDKDLNVDSLHRLGVWLHKDLEQALHTAKSDYLKEHGEHAFPENLQILVARDDEGERYVSVLFHDAPTDEALPVYPDLWAGNSDMLTLEYWDQEYGYACQA